MTQTNPSLTKGEAEFWAGQLRKKHRNVQVHRRRDTCPCRYNPDGTWNATLTYSDNEHCVTYQHGESWIHWYPPEQAQLLLQGVVEQHS